jgi:hypothetical protein
MMDFVIGWQRYETKFRGAAVTMDLRPLKSAAMFQMAPHFGGPRRQPDETVQEFIGRLTDDEKAILRNNSRKLQEISVQVFPEHVRNLKGFTINGLAPTWEDLAAESIFMELCTDICGQLAVISTIDQGSEKNSKPPYGSHPPDGAANLSFSDRPQDSG